MNKTLYIVAGPTAVGKTAFAIELAKHFNTEIVSCDSRQIYKEISIGTAKPSEEELNAVKHHFINSHSIETLYSAGDYERDALKLLDQLFEKHDNVVMVGGTGLFVKAICEGLDHFPEIDLSIRENLNQQFEETGIEPLQEQLKKLDPEYYSKVDLSNPQRIIRALEVCIGVGQPFSSFLNKKEKVVRPFTIKKIGLEMDRAELYDRINLRVDKMIENGLLEECQNTFPHRCSNALQTVGYTEIFSYIDKSITLDEAIELVKRNTRRYAKKQLTWFKKDTEFKWYNSKEVHISDVV